MREEKTKKRATNNQRKIWTKIGSFLKPHFSDYKTSIDLEKESGQIVQASDKAVWDEASIAGNIWKQTYESSNFKTSASNQSG
jgi:hypothetical protein